MNNMHKYIVKFNKKLLINLALILSIIFSLSCVDGASDKQVVTVNPFGVGIIVFNSVPLQLFGNGADIDTIKVNTGLIPDGSTITARITGTDIERELAGCVISASATVEMGMATFEFLSPILPGDLDEIRFVNLAVIIETPDGTEIRDFVTVLINAVGIIPPEDTAVDPPSEDSPVATFLDLQFATFGFAPGTIAECMVSNPGLGSLESSQVPVRGSKQTGRLIVKYFPTPSTCGGNQIVTCMITMPNPNDISGICEDVPEDDRKVSAEVLIVQGCSDDILNPPAPNSITCTPNPITGGSSGTCTCNTDNAAGEQVCFEADGPVVTFPVSCGTASANNITIVQFDTDTVLSQVVEQARCGPSGGDGSIAGDPFVQTNITINPGDPPTLDCVPNPVQSDDFDPVELVCTCETDAISAQICFDLVTGDDITLPDDSVAPDTTTCTTSDGTGDATIIATVEPGVVLAQNHILDCCVSGGDDSCAGDLTGTDVVLVQPFVPPVLNVDCSALDTTIPPSAMTFIEVDVDGFPIGQTVCAQIEVNSITDPSTIGSDMTPDLVDCTPSDANGIGFLKFNGGDVTEEEDVLVRCFPDHLVMDSMFTPGEISQFETITIDPDEPPGPLQLACAVDPASIPSSGTSLITATASNNTPPFSQICFDIFSNTIPASDLNDTDEDDMLTVCSIMNVSDQAFATFEPDSTIVTTQNANVLCCTDLFDDMGDPGANDDCDPFDPQSIVGIQVAP